MGDLTPHLGLEAGPTGPCLGALCTIAQSLLLQYLTRTSLLGNGGAAEPRELSCPLPTNTSTVSLWDSTVALEQGLTEGACSQKQEKTAINQVLRFLSLGFQERPGFPGEKAKEEKARLPGDSIVGSESGLSGSNAT